MFIRDSYFDCLKEVPEVSVRQVPNQKSVKVVEVKTRLVRNHLGEWIEVPV